MRRTAMLVCALLATTATRARADAKKDVEALVRAEAQVIDAKASPAARAQDVIEIYPQHMSQNMAMNMYGGFADKIKHDVDKIVVGVVGGKAAWFHAVVIGTYVWTPCTGDGPLDCKKPTKERATWRLSGVAVDDHGWKLAAVMWSRALPDADLFKLADDDAKQDARIDPHDDAAKLVGAWFAGGSIAKDISSSAQATANGTAPNEIGQGPPAGKLAKAWDGLKMSATRVDGKVWGSVAFVKATVLLDAKKKKNAAVAMKLGAVLVLENGNWRWVALSFAPPDKS